MAFGGSCDAVEVVVWWKEKGDSVVYTYAQHNYHNLPTLRAVVVCRSWPNRVIGYLLTPSYTTPKAYRKPTDLTPQHELERETRARHILIKFHKFIYRPLASMTSKGQEGSDANLEHNKARSGQYAHLSTIGNYGTCRGITANHLF